MLLSLISHAISCHSLVVMKPLPLRPCCSAVAGSCTRSSRTEHSQLKISSPRCQCMRRLVESVLPTTQKANGGRQTNGAPAADMTQFIADPAISMPSPVRVMTQPWWGTNLLMRFSAIDALSRIVWSVRTVVGPSGFRKDLLGQASIPQFADPALDHESRRGRHRNALSLGVVHIAGADTQTLPSMVNRGLQGEVPGVDQGRSREPNMHVEGRKHIATAKCGIHRCTHREFGSPREQSPVDRRSAVREPGRARHDGHATAVVDGGRSIAGEAPHWKDLLASNGSPLQLDGSAIHDLVEVEVVPLGLWPQIRIERGSRLERWRRIFGAHTGRDIGDKAPRAAERQHTAVLICDLDHRQPDLVSRMDSLGTADHIPCLSAHRSDERQVELGCRNGFARRNRGPDGRSEWRVCEQGVHTAPVQPETILQPPCHGHREGGLAEPCLGGPHADEPRNGRSGQFASDISPERLQAGGLECPALSDRPSEGLVQDVAHALFLNEMCSGPLEYPRIVLVPATTADLFRRSKTASAVQQFITE